MALSGKNELNVSIPCEFVCVLVGGSGENGTGVGKTYLAAQATRGRQVCMTTVGHKIEFDRENMMVCGLDCKLRVRDCASRDDYRWYGTPIEVS